MRAIHMLLAGLAACQGAISGPRVPEVDRPNPDDADGDGVEDAEDCAPEDAGRFPGNAELCDFIDQDCDGAIDDVDHDLLLETRTGQGGPEREGLRYDAYGHVIAKWWIGVDGSTGNTLYKAAYDDHGRILDEWGDRFDEGRFRWHAHTDRDAAGRVMAFRRFEDADEAFVRTCTYPADDGGLCLVDDDGIGLHGVWSRETVDRHGNIVLYEEADASGVFQPTGAIAYVYDDEGRVVRAASDDGPDEGVDREVEWGFDLHGREVLWRERASGPWRERRTSWGATAVVTVEDGAWSELPYRTTTEEMDAHGRTTVLTDDFNSDGNLDYWATYAYALVPERVVSSYVPEEALPYTVQKQTLVCP